MIRRNTTQRQPKAAKTSKNQDASCSRIGSEYQAVVPDFVYAPSRPYQLSASNLEINVWRPSMAPISSVLEGVFQEASKNSFPNEAVHVFLHCHNYDISRTLTDLPNYHPLLNTWNKHEVQRFLKCVDSKPRKNFINVKRSVSFNLRHARTIYFETPELILLISLTSGPIMIH
uniref:REST corepressor 1 n=1 Tax=Schistocephalus solidus TaxID=70667 RepID=A0A0V0JD00_SCHSO